jgi:acylglycerol lipase
MASSSSTVRLNETDFCVHVWKPDPGKDEPLAVVVIYHGFLAHGRYPTVLYAAECLSLAGFMVVSADFRGHGKSPGLRGCLPSREILIQDAMAIADYARGLAAADKAKCFLLGSSMGGTVALTVAQQMTDKIAGVVLLAPMLKLSVNSASRNLLWTLSKVFPSWQIIPSSSTDAEKQYRDPEKRKACEEDKLTIKGSSIRIGSASTCVELANCIQSDFDKVECPFLLMVADEDCVVDNQGDFDLYEKSPSTTDKTMKRYPALHGLLCEPSPLVDAIQGDMVQWIRERC